MRAALPLLLCLTGTVFGSARAEPPAAKKSPPVIGCASLANYRLLMRQVGDAAGAAALVADPKADHLGCGAINPETVTGIGDHVALDGQAYDCLGLRSTGVCQWVAAGALGPAAPRKAEPAKASKEKGRP
ncbi:hypothetical protein [Methylobacterium radiodurans]|uniref:Uncharacterized protein n=1 Tax=Methylobacterium radiodurans TaxID=2202828 RepID=A0A2U8VUY3_9HYPH|nr:hypothetical protein [Methylobacterium radiodurans]AWN37594.1 hypothetical protein DK427_19230 [Methylobacterium radiodurans]